MKNNVYRVLIFDLDGTLIETRFDIANSVNYTRAAIGLKSLDHEVISSHIGDGIELLISRSLETTDPELIQRGINIFREHYWEHCMDKSFVYPGVLDTLSSLSGTRIMAIASNKREDFTLKMVKAFGLKPYFPLIIGGDTLPVKKPDKQVVQNILDHFQEPASKAIIIGDSATDILAGKNSGITTVAVTYGIGNKDKLLDTNPSYTINKFDELVKIV